uniref:NADH dehydrogenase subunit 5 n=1 Tax=Parasteatoda cingulata TaxID=2905676 RepID=UPI002238540C|nr:NADH dehydrogenase subunit 5 [Parasteatoda cingulata]UYG23920.1 NADH dehydrogenase subunit 5 [Parasteatoda cingulata]
MFFKSNIMLSMSIMFMIISSTLLFNNMFISIEIPMLLTFYSYMNISINIDWLSSLFLATVLFISAMIIKFSHSYISSLQHNLFINLMLMFILSMSLLIMSDNIIFILLGWDGLGLSSYILVVYYQNASSSASGSITILSNRVGDIMILMSIATMFYMINWNFSMNEKFNLIIMVMLMIAAMSKSAQFPFSAWLPAAMSAPTPISALVHSSTLVTAGVYLLIRIMNFNHPMCSYFLMLISSFTAIYASMAAMWEQDMKKIIALSTLSQMAMMMYAISLNAINVAYFHLISHALFKSMMFLCAGILIHNFMYQDMRHMGSMINNSPTIISMLGISNMSLMGIPFMSGFFSKDSIIEKMILSNFSMIISFIMILSISMTSLYSFRLINITSKFVMKSKTDMTIMPNNIMENSTIKMAMFSMMFGSMYMWIYSPNQLFIIPNYMKMLILISLLMGILLSMSFSFKNNMYQKLGQPAISLWFTHMMSSNSLFNMNKYMKQSHNNDKLWQESYGPYNTFNYIMLSSNTPNMIMMSSMCLILLSMIIPIMLLM